MAKKKLTESLIVTEKPVFIEKEQKPLQPKQRLMPIENYIHLNRKGLPCSLKWKYELVRKEREGGKIAPFEWRIFKEKTYIVIND